MRGHGTFMKTQDSDTTLYASVAGVVQRVNKLISVMPLSSKYQGEIGDVVVGRIREVQQKRWKVDINCRLDAVLHLSSVNLPGGELRRRSVKDELSMRSYLQEGDLISAQSNPEDNVILSQNRANAVMNYLVTIGKVAADRLTAVGYGQNNPIGDNATEEGRQENRRTELKITAQ